MDVLEEQKKQIEAVQQGIQCENGFACCGQESHKSRFIGAGDLVECLGEQALWCGCALAFGNAHYCRCPLRLYIAQHFHR